MENLKTITLRQDCGCIEKRTTSLFKNASAVVMSIEKRCKEHQETHDKALQEETAFNTFPDDQSKQIYEILNQMIDSLGDAGVDVSYFPQSAQRILKSTAIQLTKLTN